MKRVRMLLRVSSNQQLEADGDLTVQRRLVKEYILQQPEWILDSKEYFEGGVSGYKNLAEDRDVLQEILRDARKSQFDLLVVYKDDRLGRQLWDTGMYVMALKQYGVDVYSIKDGKISPNSDDPMEQMILAMRYGIAQKSSSDTGMRVKDTAQKLVQSGKFMGGKAPYGYRLEYSGEISKHGRALKQLVVNEKEAEVVRHIYDLSLNQEFGSSKIARLLNEDVCYSKMAPTELWKSGTITSILTNPVYAGFVAYKRREKKNGKYHRLDSSEWVKAEQQNTDITIVEPEIWNQVQKARHRRNKKYEVPLSERDVTIIKRNDGKLPLIDVIYCGYCGSKLTNGTRYNYWTIKETGEKRVSQKSTYKCQNAWAGVPHDTHKFFHPEEIEPIVFQYIAEYIESIKSNDEIIDIIRENANKERKNVEKQIPQLKKELENIQKDIEVLYEALPDALRGKADISSEQISKAIKKQEEKAQHLSEQIAILTDQAREIRVDEKEWNEIKQRIPTWKDVFLQSDSAAKRVLVNKLIERIDVTADEIKIRFRINLNELVIENKD